MINTVRKIATKFGYHELCHQENIKMLSFVNGDVRINVYYSRMTIATCLKHPKKGLTQLFRRNVWEESLLSEIFRYPRKHTGMGYYKRA